MTQRNSKRKYVVDHHTKTVYLIVNSWSGAMAAPLWTKENYPGYDTKLVRTFDQFTSTQITNPDKDKS
jgi:hypothetical protein